MQSACGRVASLLALLALLTPVSAAVNKQLNAPPTSAAAIVSALVGADELASADKVGRGAVVTTVLDLEGFLEPGAPHSIERDVRSLREGLDDSLLRVYGVVVGRMQAEKGERDGVELVVGFSSAILGGLKERLRGGDAKRIVLLVISVGDRELKLVSGLLSDDRVDDIVDAAKVHLRDRAYGSAVRSVLTLSTEAVSPARARTGLFFVATLFTFSLSAAVLRAYPYVWLILLLLHLLLNHWSVLAGTLALSALHYMKHGLRPNHPPVVSTQHDPWSNV